MKVIKVFTWRAINDGLACLELDIFLPTAQQSMIT